MEYRKEIDGLRAISVLGVVLYHFELLDIPGGFYGVDVFFVISGYLISTILLKEIYNTKTISLFFFYLKRARRILPALFLVCLATYAYAAIFFNSLYTPLPGFIKAMMSSFASVSNVYFWFNTGYFEADAITQPFLHTWSLGVEEQFYVLAPLLLLFYSYTKFFWSKAKSVAFVFGLILLSLGFAFISKKSGHESFLFYMLPTRMWELLAGICVAVILFRAKLFEKSHWLNSLLPLFSLCTIPKSS